MLTHTSAHGRVITGYPCGADSVASTQCTDHSATSVPSANPPVYQPAPNERASQTGPPWFTRDAFACRLERRFARNKPADPRPPSPPFPYPPHPCTQTHVAALCTGCFLVRAVQWLKVLHSLIYLVDISTLMAFFKVIALSPGPPRLRRTRHTDRIRSKAAYKVCTPTQT